MNKKLILISTAFWNMGETSLALEIAKELRKNFDVVFFSFGGEFEYIVKKEKFKIISLKPQIDKRKTEHLYKVDRVEKMGAYFSKFEIEEQVKEEIKLFDALNPYAIITGLNFSSFISARIKKIPLFSIGHSTWLCETAIKKGKINFFNNQIDLLLPLQLKITKYIAKLYFSSIIFPYNQIMKKYGLEKFKGYEDWWSGDFTIVTEPEGFVKDMKTNNRQFFTGAIFADLKSEVLINLEKLKFENKKIIYFAVGSSGKLKVLKYLVDELGKLENYIIISPTKFKLDLISIKIPKNFIVLDWIPTKKVLPYIDIAVIHGGLGTVFSTIDSGIPFIGIPMQAEQELNIDYCSEMGFALKIKPSKNIISRDLQKFIKKLNNPLMKNKVLKYSKEMKKKKNLNKLNEFIDDSVIFYEKNIGNKL